MRIATGSQRTNTMMGRDVLSPIEPARVKVLLLPAGNVKRSRFASFVSRLEEVDEVQLSDVSPAIGSGDSMSHIILQI